MNYIQEEFLRQRAALTALMGSGDSVPTRSDSELSEETSPAAAPAIAASDTAWAYGRTAEEAAFFPAHAHRTMPTTAEVRRIKPRGDSLPGRAVSVENSFFAGETPVDEPVSFYALPHTEETAIAARDVSRAIQRDARRYDGGFSIY